MGCCKSKKAISKNKKLKFKLKEFFDFVDSNGESDEFSYFGNWKHQACYYSHLVIMLKWIMKNRQLYSNIDDLKLDLICEKLYDSLEDFNEFDLISLENKIKFMLNKNKVQAK